MLEQLTAFYPALITLLCAELFCVIVRNGEILILFKRRSQRTATEQKQVERGLSRAITLELFIFVPASVVLALLIVRPLLVAVTSQFAVFQNPTTVHALLGVASYGFPFATVKKVITRMALRILTEFATTVHNQENPNTEN